MMIAAQIMNQLDRYDAHVILTLAIEDAISTGADVTVTVSETLCCFIEFRIASALAQIQAANKKAAQLPPGGSLGTH